MKSQEIKEILIYLDRKNLIDIKDGGKVRQALIDYGIEETVTLVDVLDMVNKKKG